MMLKNPVIPIFAGLLGILSFWFAMSSNEGDFARSMLPELIGFCLEGIFFIGIFTWLQERKDSERKKELKQSLAGAMGFICQLANNTLPPGSQIKLKDKDSWAAQARKNGPHLYELLNRMAGAELTASADEIKATQQLLLTRLSTLDSLLSVSAQLSHSHLSAFNMILTEIHKLSKHEYIDAAELKSAYVNLLRLLISFNNEALSH